MPGRNWTKNAVFVGDVRFKPPVDASKESRDLPVVVQVDGYDANKESEF